MPRLRALALTRSDRVFFYGATRDEIMEVLELVSVLGMHTITTGVPVLIEELAREVD